MKVNIKHIEQSTFWNHKKRFWWFIFWGIYLEDAQYKAQTFTYRFDAKENENKKAAYNRGLKYISDMLENAELHEFEENFNPNTPIIRTRQVFAVAPYDVPLDEHTQKPDFDEKFSLTE